MCSRAERVAYNRIRYTCKHSVQYWGNYVQQGRAGFEFRNLPCFDQLVKALRYKPEGRGFNSQWFHWNFSLTHSFRPHYGQGVDSASNRNEDQEYFLVGKGGRCVSLTTLPPSCADCLKSRSLNLLESPGPVQATNGIALPFTALLSISYPSLKVAQLANTLRTKDHYVRTDRETVSRDVAPTEITHDRLLTCLQHSLFLLITGNTTNQLFKITSRFLPLKHRLLCLYTGCPDTSVSIPTNYGTGGPWCESPHAHGIRLFSRTSRPSLEHIQSHI